MAKLWDDTITYNQIGRTSGTSNSNDNFLAKKFKSVENAFGTTAASIIDPINNELHTKETERILKNTSADRDSIAKKYGYNTIDDLYVALDNAEATGDTELANKLYEAEKEDQATTKANVNKLNKHIADYDDYLKNDYISQKINQDRGKFAGSAMNTLSTMYDVMSLGAGIPNGVGTNAFQGAWEGLADELEQNGLNNFDLGRAGKNMAVGAASGAASGIVNKGLNNALAKKGGNLFKGGNKLTSTINNFNQGTKLGRFASTVGSGAARGAISGAVGGAVGAGTSSALSGVDIGQGIANTLQGAGEGAKQGAVMGGTMAGANMVANAALNRVSPNLAQSIQENQARNASYGESLADQFKGAYNSGDSVFAEEVIKPTVKGFKTVGEGISILANRGRGVSATPVQDAYAQGEASLPDALNEFIEQGGSIVRDQNGELKLVSPQSAETIEESLQNRLQSMEQPQVQEAEIVQAQNKKLSPSNTGSQWDNLARESGYNNYDEVVQRFMQANPDAEVTAGAVLTWLDNNPGGAEPLTSVKEAPTGKQIKAKREIVRDITDQFEAVDQPTARATKPNETFYNLYDEWGLSDGDDIRQAVAYAEPGSLVPEMIREAAGEAGVIDLSDAQGLIMDLKINKKNYNKYVNALEDIMDSTDTTIIGGKRGVDALELQRTLEKMASDARGTNGTYHIGNTVVDETMARNFQRIANNIGDKLDEAAVQKGVVQNVVNRHAGEIQQMKNAFPDNQTWQDAVDTKISNANTIRDLRHSIKDLTRANIFISNGDERYATFGGRYAARANSVPTTKAGAVNRVVNDLYDKIKDSKVARNARLSRNAKIVQGGTTAESTVAEPLGATSTTTVSTPATTTEYKPATQLYNAIGRAEGNTQGENSAREYLQEAAATAAPVAISNTSTTSPTYLYDSINGSTSSTSGTGNISTVTSGDYYTNLLERALNMALEANDAQAFATLFGMYQDAVAQQNKDTSSQTKLTDKQRQANAAERALNDFENMENNFGYDVSDIPVLGALANIGGNDYKSKAEALALQVGYMLSGATVNKDEAKKIGESYVPQPRDSEALRKSKLAQLRGIISDYQKTYEG